LSLNPISRTGTSPGREPDDAAMDLPPEQRAAYLDQACGSDADRAIFLAALGEAYLNANRRVPLPIV